MAKQSLLWTALPNGYAVDGKSLRVTVLVSPRLEAEADPEQLSSFGDFQDWPATLANSRFVVSFGAASVSIKGDDTASPSRVDDTLGTPESAAWAALFPGTTFVRGFTFEDMANMQVPLISCSQHRRPRADVCTARSRSRQQISYPKCPNTSTTRAGRAW